MNSPVHKRQISQYVFEEEMTANKMIFIAGPRQVGKTTWIKKAVDDYRYFNWDSPAVRRRYRNDPLFFMNAEPGSKAKYIIFDEIHKRAKWKDILKGCYDSTEGVQYIVTGSARLDTFRKSGDSLVGRYFLFHLMPFSMSDLLSRKIQDLWLATAESWKNPVRHLFEMLDSNATAEERAAYDGLFKFGGFPEPLFRGSERFLRRWQEEYLALLYTEDLRDLTNIRAIDTVEHLVSILPEKIAAPLSINVLAAEIETSFQSTKNYLKHLEKLWLVHPVMPWSKKISRSLKKEAKYYFLNWCYVPERNTGARFENFVASNLLRAKLVLNDLAYGRVGLFYVRTLDKLEVDFLLTFDNQPGLFIECKNGDANISRSSLNMARRLGVPLVQLVNKTGIFRKVDKDCLVVSADRFLKVLP
ncbi:MAG: hypothetical protein A2583_07800 [Bdellovibrionales bacterium RIFOXYD1_FULL_53_11]|nr:MAG: hypothetical protein A2583_07800 [Bdellovibrionales bacterium RIFOXYD1_FULL_53_11]